MSRRIDELGEIDLSDNIALKRYLDTLKVLCYDLYTEVSWSAEMLQQRLANVKGIKNAVRAKVVASALKGVAEAFKIAGGGVQKTWTLFENRFAVELSEAASAKKPTKPDFTIK